MHFRIIRIDGEQVALEADLLEVFQDTCTAIGTLRNPDHSDGGRIQKATQILHVYTAIEMSRKVVGNREPVCQTSEVKAVAVRCSGRDHHSFSITLTIAVRPNCTAA